MSDQPPESRPAPPPEPDPTPTRVLPPDQPPPAPKQRLSERLWSFRAVIAVALASVIVGGLGGAALASVAQDDDQGRFGPGQVRFNRGGPGGPGTMDERRRERMEEWKEWRDQRGQGRRWWGQDGPPVVPPSGVPSPARPTPTG
ncbi:MAG: hypothetical protein ABWX73_04980 [Marmoricola sp.]